ncbi:hypothetical protein DM860_008987 [Cuscuta australis]|uniref:SPARK domain-containing protein n=1 Tax=Cuscuta australis TaxID=267555 RepID=A0A328D7Z1_9ASTE|nr:hypothetical protein DM860_008987 [Cuscuta australis]
MKKKKMEPNFSAAMAIFLCFFVGSFAGLLYEQAQPAVEPPGTTIQAFPVQPETQRCKLDFSAELFGGVKAACPSGNLDRNRCCPVLAAWVYAAYARSALQVSAAASPSPPSELPMMPNDDQSCVSSLQDWLQRNKIEIPRPNSTCDTVLCFCGIRLHRITSLTCSAAFNVSVSGTATPTSVVTDLAPNCRQPSFSGCTQCLKSLQKIKGGAKNATRKPRNGDNNRATRMLNEDCQLMGLTWLLARNKTAYIPTVSAVLRAIMYSGSPAADGWKIENAKCSQDQENMPLAVDSSQFKNADSSSSSSIYFPISSLILMINIHILLINYYSY